MFLKIKGIGKILDSTIEMKGLTVIAGENNTGKSTYGKALYCMFNAFQGAEAAVYNERVEDVCRILYKTSFAKFYIVAAERLSKVIVDEFANVCQEDLLTNSIRKNIVDAISAQSSIALEEKDTSIDELIENIKLSLSVNKDEIQKTIISRYFKHEFKEQINHVNKPKSTGNITLDIQGKIVDATIKNNMCDKFSDNVGICHSAIYIDTPFVMDAVRMYYGQPTKNQVNHRDKLLQLLAKEQSDKTVIEEVIINKKNTSLLSSIHSVVNGEFKEDKKSLMFVGNGLKKPIPLSGVSSGIKMFLIIKRLLELGEIKERDVLILDEPEIHLHPAWQLQFAEVLVLLQKEFNLTMLLATHSPYFLNAIEVYGEKHGIKDKVKFYLAENNGDTAGVKDVTDNVDIIYKQLAAPFQKLEDITFED